MYGIVQKIGRGSWQMATSRLFDDKEKADAAAQRIASSPDIHQAIICKAVWMGDPEDWLK